MECKVLLVFDDMIADMHHNKTLNSLNLFIRRRKLKISLFFVTQSYFKVPLASDSLNVSGRMF